MSTERTFAIIKPDAYKSGYTGRILARIEQEGFTIRAMRLTHLSKREAEGFYAVHRERPFFGELTDFMSSGPCVVLALEAPDAIKKWRTLMGATDPAKADAGTLRVKRELEGGWFQWVTLPTPAVLTIQSGINQLRYATLKGIMAAKKKEIRQVAASPSVAAAVEIIALAAPTRSRQAQMLTGTPAEVGAELVRRLRDEARAL